MSSVLDDSVKRLNGVGKVRMEAYSRMHIYTLRDLLSHYPRAYEYRGNIVPIANAVIDGKTKNSVILTVGTAPRNALIRRGMELLKFRAYDDSGICEITFFNQSYLKNTFTLGSSFRFFGKVEMIGNKCTMTNPLYEPYFDGCVLPTFYSVYSLSEGLTQKQLAVNIAEALSVSATVEDSLPEEIRRRFDLCTKNYALRTIHNPTDGQSLAIAKKRLIFDELFSFALGMSIAKRLSAHGRAYICAEGDLSLFKSQLPYSLTGAQERTINEICADMSRDVPMARMVVGDVGCGKTVCAAAAIFEALSSGKRAALMAPTGILAHQHFGDLAPIFERLGYKCALLTGSVTPANKRKIYEQLACPASCGIQLVIGTQALISDAVNIAELGLVITDEQHRFGVCQRSVLSGRSAEFGGIRPHMLVMSATPIPRSLALVLFGDLDISKIDEMPPGRQRVDTFVVDESYRARLDGFIRKNVDAGGQVYVVCPAVEEQESSDGEVMLSEIGEYISGGNERRQPPLKAAVVFAADLQARLGDMYCVAFVHGKMKQDEKSDIMTRFANGEIDVLVSTTVIEVGVNVPNASLMIVENAERFGLSQLHQLRGRVGRGNRKSYCVLVAGAPMDGSDSNGASLGKSAKQRLEVMRTTYDGYVIAEKDLSARGPGDFLGAVGGDKPSIRQSGGFAFRLADMCEDSATLYDAFAAASRLLTEDPMLEMHPTLADEVTAVFESQIDIIS